MQTRAFGKTGEKVAELTLGCMRFPNEATAIDIVKQAVKRGMNYFETSVGYCDGQSEVWLGRGLRGLRDQVLVSTKSSPGAGGADEARRNLETSLERLGVDYVDFYHAWNINTPEKYAVCTRKGGWLEGIHKAMDEGLIRHLGFTTHCPPGLNQKIIADGIFETMTIQYNLLLRGYEENIAQAAEAGLGVVVMGPLAGGLLSQASALLKKACSPEDPIQAAFRYVLSNPAVSTASSGMRSVAEVNQNADLADSFTDYRQSYSQEILDRLEALLPDPAAVNAEFCAGCRYCQSACPSGLRPFDAFLPNNLFLLGGMPPNADALAEKVAKIQEKCTSCRLCEEICPQKLQIPELFETVRQRFTALGS